MLHGNRSRYSNDGCRCEECTAANRKFCSLQDYKRATTTPFDDIPHGWNGYQHYKCRCDICRPAGIEHMRKQRRDRKYKKRLKSLDALLRKYFPQETIDELNILISERRKHDYP